MRLFPLLGLLIFWTTTAAAQPASVSGYIRDGASGETLIGATVIRSDTTVGTVANTAGYYTLGGLRPGSYTLVYSYIGFAKATRSVTLAPGERRRLDVDLFPEGVQTAEIVVEATADAEADRQAIGLATVTPALALRVPATLEPDLFRAIQLLPGVAAASDFSSALYVRGGSPDQTLILLDRTTVYNPAHFFGLFSTFNPDAIKDARLYKGAYPAAYGGRLGSVLDIYNKDGNRRQTAGKASIGLLAARLSLEGPLGSPSRGSSGEGRGSWTVAARRSTLEPLLSVLRKKQDNIPESFSFIDLNGKLTYDAGPSDKLALSGYLGQDKVGFPITGGARFDLFYGNRTGSLSWTHLIGQRIFTNLTATGSRYFNRPAAQLGGTSFSRDNRVDDGSLRGDIEILPGGRFDTKAGFWGGYLTTRITDTFDGQQTLTSRIPAAYGATYVEETWRPSDLWTAVAGLRAAYFSNGRYLRLEPRASLDRQFDGFRLQAAYGHYNQFLTLITNEAIGGFDIWLTTDEGVQPSSSDQVAFGIKTDPQRRFTTEFEVYYRTMRHLFELNPFLPDVAGLRYRDLFRIGSGYAYGAELLVQKPAGRLNGLVAYTFGQTRRRFPREDGQYGYFYPPKFDRTNDLHLVANYELGRRWTATGVFSYATGQTYTQLQGTYDLVNRPTGASSLGVSQVGRLNASRLPVYHRLDLGFSRTNRFFSIGTYELQLQAINVYSRRNVWFYLYDRDKQPIERQTVGMLPFLPNVSFTVTF